MIGIHGSTALITDIERRKALAIVRSLGRAGVRVVGLSYARLPLCQFSKYCDHVYLCPDYRESPAAFLECLEDIIQRESPDVFYPIEDVVLELVVRNPDRWRNRVAALVPTAEALENAYDKWKTLQVAEKLGVPVPQSYCPSNEQEVAEIASGSSKRHWVVKPRKSSGSRGLIMAESAQQLVAAYRTVSKAFPRPIVQERIPRQGAGVGSFFLLGEDGELLARFGHRRLREYPINGGPSTLRESYYDEELLETSEALVRKLGCAGVSMVEYKYDERRQQFVLMEVNPRFWGSLALAVHAGVDFPVLYHQASLGLKFEPVLSFASGYYCRWLWPGDILHFFANPDRFRLNPSFFDFGGSKTTYDILSREDPWPAVGIALEALRKLVSREH